MQPPRPLMLPRLAAGLAGLALLAAPVAAPAAEASAAQLQALEAALNGQGDLEALLESGPGLDPQLEALQRRSLLAAFPDARWSLKPGKPLKDGRATVQLQVSGSRQEGPTRYRLESRQQLVLSSNGSRINGQTLLREESLLRSGDTYHLMKHWIRLRPDQCGLGPADLDRFRPRWIRWHRRLGVPLRRLRRQLLVWLGVRGPSGHAHSEQFAEEALRDRGRG